MRIKNTTAMKSEHETYSTENSREKLARKSVFGDCLNFSVFSYGRLLFRVIIYTARQQSVVMCHNVPIADGQMVYKTSDTLPTISASIKILGAEYAEEFDA
jgi:hypothetical protein